MASSAQSEIGPSQEPRWRIYDRARSIQQLAQLAMECSIAGSQRLDLPRAEGCFDRMRALLGPGDAGEEA